MKVSTDSVLIVLAATLLIAGAIGQSGAIVSSAVALLVIVTFTNRKVR